MVVDCGIVIFLALNCIKHF